METKSKQKSTIDQIEEDYRVFKVRNYIKNNPGCTKAQIQKWTGVLIEEINKFIEEGKVVYTEKELDNTQNNLSMENRSKFLEQLKYQKDKAKRYEDTGSKLVRDLEKKHKEMGR